MTKKADNKIGIPWYRRNVRLMAGDDMDSSSISFNLPPSPKPNTEPRARQPVRQPATQPATEPAKQPVRAPFLQPDFQPNPFPLPFPNPFPFPPLPERKPDNRNPAPQGNPAPLPQPAFPQLPLIPAWATDPNYDWEAHWKRVAEALPEPAPVPEKKLSPVEQAFHRILDPIITLVVLNEVKNQYIKVNVTDPIYNRMLEQPVLGSVLREAEKANMDAETVGTILANFDWENGDYKELEKQLAVGVGVAGAARLMVFIIGRKVVFKL